MALRPSTVTVLGVRSFFAGLAVAAAVSALVACSSNSSGLPDGTAAVVGGASITVERVDALVEEMREQAGATSEEASRAGDERAVLRHLLGLEVVREAARRQGISVSPQKAAAEWLAGELGSPMTPDSNSSAAPRPDDLAAVAIDLGLPRSVVLDQMQLLVLLEELGAETGNEAFSDEVFRQLADVSRELGVAVNSRYGTWNHDELLVVAPEP